MVGQADIPLIAGSGAGLILVILLILFLILIQRRRARSKERGDSIDDEEDHLKRLEESSMALLRKENFNGSINGKN